MSSIDVVYVLGKGTAWSNNEIRFSLRSVEKNLKGVRKIWVIGEKPDFLKNVNHIPYPDELVNNADGNIIRKVLRACQEEKLTDDFLFINDDHLIMKQVTASEIPPYQKGDLAVLPKEFFEVNFWRLRLYRTRNILQLRGFSALHFDCHCPIVFNKKRFPEVISLFDYAKNTGYTMKSLYGNVVHPDAPLMTGEKKILFRPYTMEDIKKRTADCIFASFNDDGLTPALKEWLYDSFPKPSKYEKIQEEDAALEVIKWLRSDQNFEEGTRIFERYGKARKAKKYFGKGETKARSLKLEHKMKELLNYL